VVIGALLIGVSFVLVVGIATSVLSALRGPNQPLTIVLAVLDSSLVLFIVAELLHTVRITVRRHTLDAEPFLVVGIIAVVRRVLVLTAQSERSFQWNPQGIELTILMALLVATSLAILLWRRSAR
jgi:uncharacterized membrane protein (DUF373 family)